MAAFSWRLPWRSKRWRSVRPEEAGIGAQPAKWASWASEAKRLAPAISPISLPAVSEATPGTSNSAGQ